MRSWSRIVAGLLVVAGFSAAMRLTTAEVITPRSAGTAATQTSGTAETIRYPAVAGLFYPSDRGELSRDIDKLLAGAKRENLGRVRALICPHAGYPFSGPVAASAYRQIEGQKGMTAIVLGPSHYSAFDGISVCCAGQYRTPLGDVAIPPRAAELARMRPFAPESAALVQRPEWSLQSPVALHLPKVDTPHTWEHSVEVQVPFLQKSLGSFSIVPCVCGEVDPDAAADVLAKIVDDRTLIVASSDLSHYYPYNDAKDKDQRCVGAVCAMDEARMAGQEACGKTPIIILMHLAGQKGWKPRLLDYRNSGDTAGDKKAVVGYAAIAFVEPPRPAGAADDSSSSPSGIGSTVPVDTRTSPPGGLSSKLGDRLVELARTSLEQCVRAGKKPDVDPKTLPAELREAKGCFVTLTKHGELRGCVGHIFPDEPLYKGVLDNAQAAALHDSRFSPVQASELPDIKVEVSVLTVPEPLQFSSPEQLLARLRPNQDGVVLKVHGRTSTFLPQVWEELPDKEQFLGHLSSKAGCAADAWRDPGTEVLIYRVQAFHEPE